MADKRAEIEVQFNWIFVLVIGALILGFFGTIIYQQKSISETKTTHEILSRLDTVFTASSTSKDKLERIETPDVEFRFNYPDYFVDGQRQNLKGKFIFAPSYFKGSSFSIWVKSWNLDFAIVNFAYVTNPTVRYYIIADSNDPFANSINESIERKQDRDSPENLIRMDFIEQEDMNKIEDKGYERVRLIYFQEDNGDAPSAPPMPSSLSSRPNSEVSALVVVPSPTGEDGDLAFGKLYFYKKNNQGQFVSDDSEGESSFSYVGRELLYGAIFVDKAAAYQYLFNKAMNKLEIISKIYEQRADMMNEDNIEGCGYPSQDFQLLSEAAKTSNVEGINGIIGIIPVLAESNERLSAWSCPPLY